MAKKKASKKAAGKDLATAQDQFPITGVDFEADSGAGMEGADKDSFAIPFLAVIQKMSPQVDEADPKYIEGARPGMLMDTVTEELFDGKEGVLVLPCAFQRRYLRWGPREAGGGFKGELTPEEATALEQSGEVVNVDNRLYYPDDNGNVDPKKCDFLQDSRNHFVLRVNPETGKLTEMLLSLRSTQISKSKTMMTKLQNVKVKGKEGMVTPPTWVNRVRITTVPESNDKGSWHGIKVELEGFIQSTDEYAAGKRLHDIIREGDVRVNYDEPVTDKF